MDTNATEKASLGATSLTNKHLIKSPEELAALCEQLAAEEKPSAHHVHLYVFSPLAHAGVLAECRIHSNRYMRDSEGRRCGPSDNEYLDMTPLSKAWREQWKTIPVANVSGVTFDMALPSPDEGVEVVKWNHPDRKGIKIHAPEMGSRNLINTLALEMHMRSKGSVKMDVVHETKVDIPGFGMVKSYIEALETNGRSSREKTLKERTRS